MGGWNYFEESPSSRAHWNYGPGDYDYDDRPSRSALDFGEHREWDDEDEERFGHEPNPLLVHDPGFREHEGQRFAAAASYAESYRAQNRARRQAADTAINVQPPKPPSPPGLPGPTPVIPSPADADWIAQKKTQSGVFNPDIPGHVGDPNWKGPGGTGQFNPQVKIDTSMANPPSMVQPSLLNPSDTSGRGGGGPLAPQDQPGP